MNDESPRRRASRSKHPPLHSKDPVDLDRHRRKCQICNHPNRELIEEAFIRWYPNRWTMRVYNLEPEPFYRHAQAMDLYTKRRNNVRASLEHVIERGVETEVNGDTFLRAIRAYVCLTDDNQWVEPTSHVVFSKALLGESTAQAATPRPPLQEPAPQLEDAPSILEQPLEESNSNTAVAGLEIDATY
jgi:hypothetical protein